MRELVVNTKNAKKYKGVTAHQTRILPAGTRHETDILIYNNKVAFISFDKSPTAYVIEDAAISLAQSALFEVIWKNS